MADQPIEEVDVRRPLPRNVRLLGFVSLLNDLSSEMVYPLIPMFLLDVLHGSRAQLGLIEGFGESVASLLKLVSGGLSDRLGRRKGLVVLGYALAVLVRPLTGLATAPWHLFSVRLADRIGKGIRTAPRDALVAESTEPRMRGRAFGFHRAMDHLGAALGPLVATAILWFYPQSLRVLFLVTAVPGVLVLLAMIFGLREQPFEPTSSQAPGGKFRDLGRPFRDYLIALFIFTLGNSSDMFLLVRARELGVAATWIPSLWIAFHVLKSIGSWLAGQMVDRLGARPMIVAGWGIYAIVYVLMAFASQAWHVWALFLVYGVYYSLTEPAERTLVAQLVGPARKGLAYGFFNLTLGIAALPASIVCGFLYDSYGPFAAFGTGAALALVSSALLMRLRT